MLSRRLKISKPIWHYLHHRRPFKFASVEWVWQAITPMQDIGNLTRICSDKSGRSGGGVPWGREGGGEGRVAAKSRLTALQEEIWGLMQQWITEDPPRVTDTCKPKADLSKHTSRHQLTFRRSSAPLSFCITLLLRITARPRTESSLQRLHNVFFYSHKALDFWKSEKNYIHKGV